MRTFNLLREEDPTGISGTGDVAEGCEFADGTVVLHWTSWPRSTGVYPSIDSVYEVHCHGGMTRVVWL